MTFVVRITIISFASIKNLTLKSTRDQSVVEQVSLKEFVFNQNLGLCKIWSSGSVLFRIFMSQNNVFLRFNQKPANTDPSSTLVILSTYD